MKRPNCCTGVVTAVSDGQAQVRLADDASQCAGCSISYMCNGGGTAGTTAPVVTVDLDAATVVAPGDTVTLSVREASRWIAILVCFILPVVYVCFGAGFVLAIGGSELLAAVTALVLPMMYFLMLYFMRRMGYAPYDAKVWSIESIEKQANTTNPSL